MIEFSSKTQRRIYLFYLFVLIFALTWRLANADSKGNEVKNIALTERLSETELTITLDRAIRPLASFIGEERCLVLDFKGVSQSRHLLQKSFAGRDLRLGYVSQVPELPDCQRVRLYLRSGCLASMKYQDRDVVVRIAEKTSMSESPAIKPGVLLNPSEAKYAPVVISLHDAPIIPVIGELASNAGFQVEVSGKVPERFSLEKQFESPLDAIRQIALSCGLAVSRRGMVLSINRSDKEKPRIYAYSGELLSCDDI